MRFRNPDTYRPQVENISHHFYLVNEIGDADDYLDLFEALNSASKTDKIHIHINTPGGDLSTVAQILHHMYSTDGYVITHGEGMVASGGSLIFFAGHSLDVGPFSEYLAHGPHGFDGGKLRDRVDAHKHHSAYVKQLYTEVYSPFYSAAEIKKILNGKEHYETAAQMEQRLLKAKEYFEKE